MRPLKTFFRQSCPVCGRPLNVPIELLGSEASCSHCTGVFTANGLETEERHGSGKFFGIRQSPENDCRNRKGVTLERFGYVNADAEALCGREFS